MNNFTSNLTNNTTTETDVLTQGDVWRYYQLSASLLSWIPPFILLFGVPGNVVAAVVMSRRRMRRTPSALYLIAVAVADNVVLLIGLAPRWVLYLIHERLSSQDVWFYRWRKYVYHSSGDVSVWLLTAFTVDRFIAVCFPLRVRSLCTHKRIRTVTACVTLLALSWNLQFFWIFGVINGQDVDSNQTTCCNKVGFTPAHEYYARNVRPWIVNAYYNILPFLIMLFSNLAICRVMCMRRLGLNIAANHDDAKQLSSMTCMAVGVSLAFLVLTTPAVIVYAIMLRVPQDSASRAPYAVAHAVCDLLMFTNHAVNFYLYCLSGSRFRQELKTLFPQRSVIFFYLNNILFQENGLDSRLTSL